MIKALWVTAAVGVLMLVPSKGLADEKGLYGLDRDRLMILTPWLFDGMYGDRHLYGDEWGVKGERIVKEGENKWGERRDEGLLYGERFHGFFGERYLGHRFFGEGFGGDKYLGKGRLGRSFGDIRGERSGEGVRGGKISFEHRYWGGYEDIAPYGVMPFAGEERFMFPFGARERFGHEVKAWGVQLLSPGIVIEPPLGEADIWYRRNLQSFGSGYFGAGTGSTIIVVPNSGLGAADSLVPNRFGLGSVNVNPSFGTPSRGTDANMTDANQPTLLPGTRPRIPM